MPLHLFRPMAPSRHHPISPSPSRRVAPSPPPSIPHKLPAADGSSSQQAAGHALAGHFPPHPVDLQLGDDPDGLLELEGLDDLAISSVAVRGHDIPLIPRRAENDDRDMPASFSYRSGSCVRARGHPLRAASARGGSAPGRPPRGAIEVGSAWLRSSSARRISALFIPPPALAT